jgi:hypothetical protein
MERGLKLFKARVRTIGFINALKIYLKIPMLFEKVYDIDICEASYKLIRIGGEPQEITWCQHAHDCCGNFYCMIVSKYLRGLITVGHYYKNV